MTIANLPFLAPGTSVRASNAPEPTPSSESASFRDEFQLHQQDDEDSRLHRDNTNPTPSGSDDGTDPRGRETTTPIKSNNSHPNNSIPDRNVEKFVVEPVLSGSATPSPSLITSDAKISSSSVAAEASVLVQGSVEISKTTGSPSLVQTVALGSGTRDNRAAQPATVVSLRATNTVGTNLVEQSKSATPAGTSVEFNASGDDTPKLVGARLGGEVSKGTVANASNPLASNKFEKSASPFSGSNIPHADKFYSTDESFDTHQRANQHSRLGRIDTSIASDHSVPRAADWNAKAASPPIGNVVGSIGSQGYTESPVFDLSTHRSADTVTGLRSAGGVTVNPQVTVTPDPIRQIAEAVRVQRSEHSITLRLDPPDLGSVSIDLSFDKSARLVTAVLAADQNDTSTLLRRHLDNLQRELASSGFENVNVELGQHKSEHNPSAEESLWGIERARQEEQTQSKTTRRHSINVIGSDRIDARF